MERADQRPEGERPTTVGQASPSHRGPISRINDDVPVSREEFLQVLVLDFTLENRFVLTVITSRYLDQDFEHTRTMKYFKLHIEDFHHKTVNRART